MLKEGCSWRALDVPDIAWQTVYGHFRRWAKAGLWDQAMQQMKWRAGKDLGMVDATHIKVHRDGANPAGGQEKQAMSRTKGARPCYSQCRCGEGQLLTFNVFKNIAKNAFLEKTI